jgi:hypothetical protein
LTGSFLDGLLRGVDEAVAAAVSAPACASHIGFAGQRVYTGAVATDDLYAGVREDLADLPFTFGHFCDPLRAEESKQMPGGSPDESDQTRQVYIGSPGICFHIGFHSSPLS